MNIKALMNIHSNSILRSIDASRDVPETRLVNFHPSFLEEVAAALHLCAKWHRGNEQEQHRSNTVLSHENDDSDTEKDPNHNPERNRQQNNNYEGFQECSHFL